MGQVTQENLRVPGTLEDRDLLMRANDADEQAMRALLDGEQMIVVEQPQEGKTAADDGVEVTKIPVVQTDATPPRAQS